MSAPQPSTATVRPGFERAAMGAGVDAEGEAADHDEPGGGQVAAQLARDLAAVGAGPPRADDGDRASRLEPVAAEPGRRGRSAPRAHRRRRAARPGRAGRGGSRPSTARPAGRPRSRCSAMRGDLGPGSAPATFGAAAATRSSLESRSSSGEREPGAPVAIFSMYGARWASSRERRRQSGQALGLAHSRSLLRSCSAWAICSRSIVSAPAEVGDRPRQPQHPIVGATAEARGASRARRAAPRLLASAHSRASAGSHLRVAAPGPEATLLALPRGRRPARAPPPRAPRRDRRSPRRSAGGSRRGCRSGRPARR